MARYEITNETIPIDFEGASDFTQRTIQNAKNLLMCRMGEIPFDRQRGFNPALYDLPLEEMRERLTEELDRVMLWEPDAEVVSATATRNDAGEVIIRCVIEIDEE